jgi:hypothetical protein
MSTTKLAEAAQQYLIATAHLGACPGTREVLKQALASYEAKPAVQVVVERERVWVKRGVQSFALAYEADTDAEREWYAGQLRTALAAPAAPAEPIHPEFRRGYELAIDDIKEARESEFPMVVRWATSRARVWVVFEDGAEEVEFVAAPAAPAPEPLTDEQIEGGRSKLFSVGNPFCPITEKAMRTAVRWAERCHGIVASKGEQA